MTKLVRRCVAEFRKFAKNASDWIVAQFVLVLLFVLRLMPMKTALNVMGRLAKIVGPKTKRHKLAIKNLQLAFPEKTDVEREQIALEMWTNMARLAAEYVYLDQISVFDPDSDEKSNIEVIGREVFLDLVENKRPFIVFTIHSGNFELLPIISQRFDLSVSALFRPPNNKYIAEKVLAARGEHMKDLVASTAGAAWNLARKLDSGGGVGMLVDQKFSKGGETQFFGHTVKTNPLLAKLARQYKCDVFPARCVRLPQGRFRLELEPAIDLPKTHNGEIDIPATSQLLNDKVEEWVREYPGQWQWFHDRWNIKHTI
ncbi:MAG: lipid A biosynthesis lauroyl acyltransferase [Rhizobiaceae bacterium]|nr:lipid A biosynthesis lauroyl acyltransferase [Rhizobiaceae bacterium]